jgi:hypothetical protein
VALTAGNRLISLRARLPNQHVTVITGLQANETVVGIVPPSKWSVVCRGIVWRH